MLALRVCTDRRLSSPTKKRAATASDEERSPARHFIFSAVRSIPPNDPLSSAELESFCRSAVVDFLGTAPGGGEPPVASAVSPPGGEDTRQERLDNIGEKSGRNGGEGGRGREGLLGPPPSPGKDLGGMSGEDKGGAVSGGERRADSPLKILNGGYGGKGRGDVGGGGVGRRGKGRGSSPPPPPPLGGKAAAVLGPTAESVRRMREEVSMLALRLGESMAGEARTMRDAARAIRAHASALKVEVQELRGYVLERPLTGLWTVFGTEGVALACALVAALGLQRVTFWWDSWRTGRGSWLSAASSKRRTGRSSVSVTATAATILYAWSFLSSRSQASEHRSRREGLIDRLNILAKRADELETVTMPDTRTAKVETSGARRMYRDVKSNGIREINEPVVHC